MITMIHSGLEMDGGSRANLKRSVFGHGHRCPNQWSTHKILLWVAVHVAGFQGLQTTKPLCVRTSTV